MIGVFDSGFGGLSVLKEVERALPEYQYIYLGDTARAPYGSRTSEEVYQFTREAIDFLFAKGCQLILLACNTTSAEALRKIQQEYLPLYYPDRRVLGVIIPAAEEAILKTKSNRVGVIATEGTVKSNTFVRELQKLRPDTEVFQQACPLLVSLVEAGEHASPASEEIVRGYITSVLSNDIDTLILGCTHYEHLLSHIQKIVGEQVTIISESEVIARKLREYLYRHSEFEKRLLRSSGATFYTTDTTSRFSQLAPQFFGRQIHSVQVRLMASRAAL
jgi:glutamate racemase